MRTLAEIAPNVGFLEFDFNDLYLSTFEKIELGRMKKLLPLHAMAENFGIVRKELARVRATTMEGSFGTQKEHYGLRKVAARIKSTEIMRIFFGVHTANVVNLVRRESAQLSLQPDALNMEPNFMGVVAPAVTENE